MFSIHRRQLSFAVAFVMSISITSWWCVQASADQVVNDDQIVRGSICVGSTDCAGDGSESFGTAYLKLKGADPVLLFQDSTSTPGSPTTDWRLSGNNGGDRFTLEDADHGTVPFVTEANAPDNALYINSSGNVGLGTATPAHELHIRVGHSPTLRLEQDGTPLFSPQKWDLGGNDSSFFIRDAGPTGGSTRLPFQIRVEAPTDSFVIDRLGRVGLGTFTPRGNLHIFGGATDDVFNGIGPDPSPTPTANAFNFGYSGNSFGSGSGFFNVRPAIGVAGVAPPNPSLRFATGDTQRMIIDNLGNIGIGDFGAFPGNPGVAPSARLHVRGNVLVEGNVQVVGGAFIDDGTTLNVPDYVFAPDYQLRPLSEVAAYIARERHLPEIPSAQEIQKQGIHLGEMQMRLLKKIEELTLYTLHQDRQHQEQTRTIAAQHQTIAALQQTVATLHATLENLTTRLGALEHAHTSPTP
jgi:uncharacterized coiled-coil protein SlyX